MSDPASIYEQATCAECGHIAEHCPEFQPDSVAVFEQVGFQHSRVATDAMGGVGWSAGHRGSEMLNITLGCSYCGKKAEIEICTHGGKTTPWIEIEQLVPRPWLLELNGKNLDVYCSRRCSQGDL